MATTVNELPDSREWSGQQCKFRYLIRGTASDTAAKTALLAEAAATYEDLPIDESRTEIEPVHVDSDNAAACIWHGTVWYARSSNSSEPPETGESTFSFETGGGTQHITQSLSTINSYGTSPEDYKGAIGVEGEGKDINVQGCDITVPVYNFSETHYLSNATVDSAYKSTLYSLTVKVNNAGFKGFDAGEVLFLGASGSKRGDEDWEITFRFAASPNKTGLSAGDISGIAKKGWEYLWIRYGLKEGSSAYIVQPIAAYVEQVYESGDFSGLGIS